MIPRANWPSLTPLLTTTNLMSARGSGGITATPRRNSYVSEKAHHLVYAGSQPWCAGKAWGDLAESPGESHKNCKENVCAIPSTISLFLFFFFQNTAVGVYSLTFLLKSEESMRTLEACREQHTHLYQIMQFSGCSTLNIDWINNAFQQRPVLPW